MSYVTTHKLLNDLQESLEYLRDLQLRKKENSTSPLTEQVVAHAHERETLITDLLHTIKEEMDERMAKSYEQIEPASTPLERLQNQGTPPENPADLVTWSLACNEDVADWCDTLAGNSILNTNSELFSTLADRLRALNRKLAADTRSLEQDTLRENN
jgi:hypothetical protein